MAVGPIEPAAVGHEVAQDPGGKLRDDVERGGVDGDGEQAAPALLRPDLAIDRKSLGKKRQPSRCFIAVDQLLVGQDDHRAGESLGTAPRRRDVLDRVVLEILAVGDHATHQAQRNLQDEGQERQHDGPREQAFAGQELEEQLKKSRARGNRRGRG